MKFVLLSGGSGKRLWPLSNNSRSKQFLKLLTGPGDQMESMLQRVWRQLSDFGQTNSCYIATNQSQYEIIQNQVGEQAKLIVEPSSMDTFPAIALACTYLSSVENISADEIISVLPVDPYVDSIFFQYILQQESILKETEANIALIGAKPTFPSEKYGYIVPEDTSEASSLLNAYHVKGFTEKPHSQKALELIKQGALWNCGVFSFKLDYMLNVLKENQIPTTYTEVLESYDNMEKISFDYKVVEQEDRICVTPYEGFWKDLGTWNTLTEEMGTNIIGKGSLYKVHDTHLINELDIPVNVLGLSKVVVAVSPDGILVSDKNMSEKLKDVIDFGHTPKYEERKWGWYRTLDFSNSDDKEKLVKKIGIHQGKNLSYHYHRLRTETWTILEGEGQIILNEKVIGVKEGDVIQIPRETRHAIRAITELQMIEIQVGEELIEEDIIRIFTDWEDIMREDMSGL